MVIIDTNVYIDVMEDETRAEQLAARIEDLDESVGVSSVVLSELLCGVHPDHAESRILALRTDADVLLTPSAEDWIAAGNAMRQLGANATTKRRSFWNDILIAASCVRQRATLLTSNAGDFKRIRRVIAVETVPAWS